MTGSHISLFAGVGMTDLAMESQGYKTVATAEIDEWCRGILRKRLPTAHHFADVKHVKRHGNLTGESLPAVWPPRRPLLISGGFPCQGTSASGARQGLKDPRSGLWREFARVIHEFHPDTVFVENSPMLRSRGLDRVLCDLYDLGYDAAWDCVPAAAVGAPHLRDRLFLKAWPNPGADIDYSDLERPYVGVATTAGVLAQPWLEDEGGEKFVTRFSRAGELRAGFVSELEPQVPVRNCRQSAVYPTPTRADGTGGPGTSPHRAGGKNLRTVVAEETGSGRLNPMRIEWMMGLPLGWTDPAVHNADLICHPGWTAEPCGVPWTKASQDHRGQRIAALGNGLVPQAAVKAFNLLNER